MRRYRSWRCAAREGIQRSRSPRSCGRRVGSALRTFEICRSGVLSIDEVAAHSALPPVIRVVPSLRPDAPRCYSRDMALRDSQSRNASRKRSIASSWRSKMHRSQPPWQQSPGSGRAGGVGFGSPRAEVSSIRNLIRHRRAPATSAMLLVGNQRKCRSRPGECRRCAGRCRGRATWRAWHRKPRPEQPKCEGRRTQLR
jgi:hypothetical protein